MVMADAARRAEAYWVLAHAEVSAGRGDDAITTIRQALAPADLSKGRKADRSLK
jgi:hypothetical protein